MKTFIIFTIIQILCKAREMFVNRNELITIDTFQGFGVILDANITNQSSNPHLCQIVKQKLINMMQTEISLAPLVNEGVFHSNYSNGSLKYETNYYYIVSMVPFQNGAVILFSDGHLTSIQEINGNIMKLESNEKIQIEPSQLIDPIHMYYFPAIKKIVIILKRLFIYVQVNQNETNIFGKQNNQTDEKILTTQNIEFVDDYLFIMQQKEFIIYSQNQEGLQQIFHKKLEMNFIDMKVHKENDVYRIFFLHRLQGVVVYVYDPISSQFIEISSYDMIPIKGYKIGSYEHILMIVDEHQNESIIYELHSSNQSNKWTMFNKYQVKNTINDIKFTENYAILLGRNAHEILYHSLPTVDYQIHNQIIIPGLQQIHFIDQKEPYDKKLIGITKHTYFVTNFSIAPQRIDCQYQEESGPMQFSYYQNSTQCAKLPQKREGQLCLYISNYTVHYKYPIITSEHYIYIQIVGFSFVFAILIVSFTNYYLKYKEAKIKEPEIQEPEIQEPERKEPEIIDQTMELSNLIKINNKQSNLTSSLYSPQNKYSDISSPNNENLLQQQSLNQTSIQNKSLSKLEESPSFSQ